MAQERIYGRYVIDGIDRKTGIVSSHIDPTKPPISDEDMKQWLEGESDPLIAIGIQTAVEMANERWEKQQGNKK